MNFVRVAKLWFLASLILAVSTIAFIVRASNATYEVVELNSLAAILFGLSTVFACVTAFFENNCLADEFRWEFGFDPHRDKLHLVSDDPQKYVSAEIERRRVNVQAIFERELVHNKTGDVFTPEDIRRKMRAKDDFWQACNIARKWGFKTPSSINESVDDASGNSDRLIGGTPGTHNF